MSSLSREDIIHLMNNTPSLVENVYDFKNQIQPAGIDLTLNEISKIESPGKIGTYDEQRTLSDTSPLAFDLQDNINIASGCYLVRYNEIVNLPLNIVALVFPRSSLLRCGVHIHTAVWDPGYSGRGQSLLVVYNNEGFTVKRNAGIAQMVFFKLTSESKDGYNGIFQRESL